MAAYKWLKGHVKHVPDKVTHIEQTKKALSYLLTHEETTKEKIEIVEQTVMMEEFNTPGRLAQQNRKLSKDELMTIVRFGADKIFNARGSMITDEDIDAILARGEERPESMKGKIAADMQHNIANFFLSGENGNASVSSLYKSERELFSKDTNNGDVLPSIFIALPQRERKSNYNEDEYYRPQDPAKIPVVHDHQFSQKERMVALLTKKTQVENRRKELVRLIKEVKADETRVKAPKSKAVEGAFADYKTALPAVSDKERSAERCSDLAVTETYLMNSLFLHYAHVRSKIKSMTLFADIDAATQNIHRLCCGATVDAAAVVYLMLSMTVGQYYLIGCHYCDLFKQILTECVMNTSEYGVLLQILSSPLEQVEAEMLREATTEVERKSNSILPVVMARSNAEVELQKNTYDETYGEDSKQSILLAVAALQYV
ncbi:hypothetical protein PsorP6_000794 [Peronosclerospora sorghi]|uniref:Uncharacterized protein n=1 Tax=Peronosclerospora sorghi TaxID=230839 RepID=A0ACC0WS64_9STRA|nr:hypothetical protein PsorP6_000794 [Peronosclerospora sorghi]